MSKNFSLSSIFDHSPEQPHFIILDIDSTLVTTFQRNQAILDQFCKNKVQEYPEQTQLLGKAQCRLGDYGYYTSLDRLEKKPDNPVFLEELQIYWKKNFFSNHFLHADKTTEEAVQFVKKIESAGIPFAYLTGRHKETMWEGTLKSLQELGFPISEDILILKESSKDLDSEYKSIAVTQLKENYPNHAFWIIDNEPVILHQMIKDHPDLKLVWFESCHSGKKEPPTEALWIKSF